MPNKQLAHSVWRGFLVVGCVTPFDNDADIDPRWNFGSAGGSFIIRTAMLVDTLQSVTIIFLTLWVSRFFYKEAMGL